MKFVYATLVGSALAGKPLKEFLQDKLDSIFVQNDDGFDLNLAPYFILKVEDDGWEGQIQYSIDGMNRNVDNWDVSKEGFRIWGEAYGDNAKELGLRLGDVVKSADYDERCHWSASAQGVDVQCDRVANFNYRNGAKGDLNEAFSVEVNLNTLGNSIAVEIDVDGKRNSANINQLEDHWVWHMVRPYTLKLNSNLKVNDFDQCKDLKLGCAASVDSSIDARSVADSFKSDVQLSFDLKLFAGVFKYTGSDIDDGIVFVRKLGEDGKAMPVHNQKGWFSAHWAKGSNWQKAIRAKEDKLVLRLPTWTQWKKDSFPQLMALATPWMELYDVGMSNLIKLPYIVYYMDDFFATFSNQFDCSKYVAATRVESELVADWIDVESVNSFLFNGCKWVNKWVVDAIQSDELDEGMGEMRKYVTKMNSPAGLAEYNALFGGIF